MIRFAVSLVLLCGALLHAKSDIDARISKTSKELSGYDKKYDSLHTEMAGTAKAILKEEKLIEEQQKRLDRLQEELTLKEKDYAGNKEELASLESSQSNLHEDQERIEQELVFAIARNVSLSMLLDDKRTINADALITEEVLKELAKQTKDEIADLNTMFASNSQRITELRDRSKVLKQAISDIETKRKEHLDTRRAHEKALEKLKADKVRYSRSINKLLSRKQALKKTLAKLNIIKEDEAKKAKERAAAKARAEAEAEAEAQRTKNATPARDLPKIKQVGSSYQKIKTKRYRGRKTIAPLDAYTLVKEFGPYTDPVYNIRIFNESVSLQPKQRNAKVKNVLNGKVILAQNTALLDNVIIIEHSNGMHTIYAHLDQIAPTVKQGKKIKKGSVIGRVSNELMFEVTQKNYHINPMQLIR